MIRDDYRRRIAEFRPLIATFRGPLEQSGHGGSNVSISERTPDGKEYRRVGGAVTEEDARAIVAAVNFVRDLSPSVVQATDSFKIERPLAGTISAAPNLHFSAGS